MYTWAQLAGQNPHFSIGYTGLVQQGSTFGVNYLGRASSFLNRLYWFAVVEFCTLGCNQQGRASSFLNRLYWFGVVWLCTFGVISEGGPPHFSIGYTAFVQYGSVHLPLISRAAFSFPNRLYWFAVVGLCTLGLNNKGASSFLNRLYCFGVEALYSWGQFVGEGLLISQYALLVWCSSTLHLGSISGGRPPHFFIGYTGLVQYVTLHLGLISRGRDSPCGVSRAMYCFWAQYGSVHLHLDQQCSLLISQQVLMVWCSKASVHLGQLSNKEGLLIFQYAYTGLVQYGFVHLRLQLAGEGLLISQYGYTGLVQQGSVYLGLIRRGRPPHFSIGSTGLVQQGSAYLGQPSGVGHLWCSRDLQHLGSVSKGAMLISQQGIQVWCSMALYTWGQLAGRGPPHFLIGQTGFVQQVTVHLGLISRRETLWCSRAMYTWAQ